jgi:hypothetical protein
MDSGVWGKSSVPLTVSPQCPRNRVLPDSCARRACVVSERSGVASRNVYTTCRSDAATCRRRSFPAECAKRVFRAAGNAPRLSSRHVLCQFWSCWPRASSGALDPVWIEARCEFIVPIAVAPEPTEEGPVGVQHRLGGFVSRAGVPACAPALVRSRSPRPRTRAAGSFRADPFAGRSVQHRRRSRMNEGSTICEKDRHGLAAESERRP